MADEVQIFISHASEDKSAVALPLKAALEREGLHVWLDQAELKLRVTVHRDHPYRDRDHRYRDGDHGAVSGS